MKLIIYIVFATSLLFCSSTKTENQKTIHAAKSNPKKDRDSIVSFAKQYLGTPYLYAGNDPKKGFDCSGFVSYVFKNFNIDLPRSSSGYRNIGVSLKPEEFKIGDVLVFYGYQNNTVIGHLGIICEANGMDSKFIHASSGKVSSVTISELNSDHYSKRYYKCIDVLPQ
jgi:cell wall-associated NlpC family hydrolase